MRLFLAINFDDKTKREMIKIREDLRDAVAAGKFSRDENLHLTLVFLGEIAEELIPAIRYTMNQVDIPHFQLRFSTLGSFKRDSGDIWWLGADECAPLTDLQGFLSEHLKSAGFSIENRKYKPHLTLAKYVRLKNAPKKNIPPVEALVSSISLMKSESIEGKTTYTELFNKRLI